MLAILVDFLQRNRCGRCFKSALTVKRSNPPRSARESRSALSERGCACACCLVTSLACLASSFCTLASPSDICLPSFPYACFLLVSIVFVCFYLLPFACSCLHPYYDGNCYYDHHCISITTPTATSSTKTTTASKIRVVSIPSTNTNTTTTSATTGSR